MLKGSPVISDKFKLFSYTNVMLTGQKNLYYQMHVENSLVWQKKIIKKNLVSSSHFVPLSIKKETRQNKNNGVGLDPSMCSSSRFCITA